MLLISGENGSTFISSSHLNIKPQRGKSIFNFFTCCNSQVSIRCTVHCHTLKVRICIHEIMGLFKIVPSGHVCFTCTAAYAFPYTSVNALTMTRSRTPVRLKTGLFKNLLGHNGSSKCCDTMDANNINSNSCAFQSSLLPDSSTGGASTTLPALGRRKTSGWAGMISVR